MRKQHLSLLWCLLLAIVSVKAQNPIVQTCYTADPAPMVYDGRFYVCIDRDEGPDYYVMNEWRIYSSADMVNWTDHGAVLPLTTFEWATEGSAWASQCIERNGKFYWYVCCTPKGESASVIGVAVGDSPTGPFKDALGKPLVEGGWGYIDPTPFIDDDGQAYLYFGNPGCYYVKLNEDMISYSGDVVEIEQDEDSFGGPKEPEDGVTYTDLYEEGPWLCKRNDTYYLLYAAGGVPEHIAYSTSNSPEGPWKYQGQIMPLQDTNSFTNHSGVMDFMGHSYFVYHTGWLPGGGGFTRSVCVEEFTYNDDGSFPEITATHEGVNPIGTLYPYERVEAETMAWGLGLSTDENSERGVYVCSINNGDSLNVREVDFGDTGAGVFTACVSCNTNGGTIEIHVDSKDGDIIATLPVAYTGGEDEWKELSIGVNGITGKHDIWFVFTGDEAEDNLFNFDYWQFTEKTTEKGLISLNTTLENYKIDTDAVYGNTTTVSVMAVYSDGETEDVTSESTITAADSKVETDGNIITGKVYGNSSVEVTYGGITTNQPILVRSYVDENRVVSLAFVVDDEECETLTMTMGGSTSYTVVAAFADGHIVDVTSEVTPEYSETGIVRFRDGTITAVSDGEADVTATYGGSMGEQQTALIHVKVETISLESFDPNIWGDGTYDKETHTYYPADWGDFGGWYYSTPQDWSSYGYITVELEEAPTCTLCFQFWDTESYFNDHASYDMEGMTSLSVNLHTMTLENDPTTSVSPESVYRIGFWTTLSNPVKIKSVRLEQLSTDERFSLSDLNPSIYAEGTYDAENYILVTGEYGFGGWEFSPAIDLSGYENLIVELQESQTCGAQFRLFDEDSYWSECASYNFGSSTMVTIDLHNVIKDDTGAQLDVSNITRAGFWSYGGGEIKIKSIYLTGGTEGINLLSSDTEYSTSTKRGVWSLSGVKISADDSESSIKCLPKGIYIVDGQKVLIL